MGTAWDRSLVQFNKCKKCGEVIISADRIDNCSFCDEILPYENWTNSMPRAREVEHQEGYHLDDMMEKNDD